LTKVSDVRGESKTSRRSFTKEGIAPMAAWSKRTRLQPARFEWENEPQLREVRFSNVSVQVGDPVRVAVAGVEVEGRIEGIESSTLHVRIGRRLF
jgi:hypothetical protein